MSGLSKSQKEQALKQFVSLTRATSADALRLCKKAAYRLDAAIEYFYNDNQAMSNADNVTSDKMIPILEAQFNEFKDADHPLQTDIDGTLRYLDALELSPEDPAVLCLAHLLRAPRMGIFDKKGWVEGWKTPVLRNPKDLISAQKSELARLKQSLTGDANYFTQVYRFTFDFGKDEGQKNFALESAIPFWEMLMPIAPQAKSFSSSLLQYWFELLRSKNRAISRDTWNLFLDFAKDVDPQLQNHDDLAAWPLVIDDFVEYARGKLATSRGGGVANTNESVMDTS